MSLQFCGNICDYIAATPKWFEWMMIFKYILRFFLFFKLSEAFRNEDSGSGALENVLHRQKHSSLNISSLCGKNCDMDGKCKKFIQLKLKMIVNSI